MWMPLPRRFWLRSTSHSSPSAGVPLDANGSIGCSTVRVPRMVLPSMRAPSACRTYTPCSASWMRLLTITARGAGDVDGRVVLPEVEAGAADLEAVERRRRRRERRRCACAPSPTQVRAAVAVQAHGPIDARTARDRGPPARRSWRRRRVAPAPPAARSVAIRAATVGAPGRRPSTAPATSPACGCRDGLPTAPRAGRRQRRAPAAQRPARTTAMARGASSQPPCAPRAPRTTSAASRSTRKPAMQNVPASGRLVCTKLAICCEPITTGMNGVDLHRRLRIEMMAVAVEPIREAAERERAEVEEQHRQIDEAHDAADDDGAQRQQREHADARTAAPSSRGSPPARSASCRCSGSAC